MQRFSASRFGIQLLSLLALLFAFGCAPARAPAKRGAPAYPQRERAVAVRTPTAPTKVVSIETKSGLLEILDEGKSGR
jgi:hypothetical protein